MQLGEGYTRLASIDCVNNGFVTIIQSGKNDFNEVLVIHWFAKKG